MRLADVWGIACLVVAAASCSVSERTGLRVAGAAMQDAGRKSCTDCDADDGGPTPAESIASTCHDGECWWSHEQNGCHSASVPTKKERPRGAIAEGSSMPEFYLGFTRLRLGETDEKGAPNRDAWQNFGLDLDGVCTSAPSCPSTQRSCRAPGPQSTFDGNLCRDNAFASLMPVAAAVPEIGKRFGLSESLMNCNLWRGTYNMILKVSEYNGRANDSNVRVDFYISPGTERAPNFECPRPDFADSYPLWRASSVWKIDPENLTGPIRELGKLPDSKVADATAYVREGYLVANFPDSTLLRLAGDGRSFRGFAMLSSQNVWLGRLHRDPSGRWQITDGIFGGRIRSDDLIRSFRQVGLCEGAGLDNFYKGTVEWIEQSVDVRLDGTVEEDSPCDAISSGLGFEAAQLTPGSEEKATPIVECCAPGVAIEDCNPSCGDGRVNGKEKCDMAIGNGQPGACPRSCPAIDACTPAVLEGVGCDATCVAKPITQVGAQDGCCPPHADATVDPDCAAVCGNGVLEAGETCDPKDACPSCKSDDQCLVLTSKGDAASCSSSCSFSVVSNCRNADGCCPSGCDSDNDDDCSSTCGNGKIDAHETCDSSPSCPESCDDKDPCTIDLQTGSASHCSVRCTHFPVTAARSGDQCCPKGASRNTDSDCAADCGNRIVEAGEDCDDGNKSAGDGCTPDCKSENVIEACLANIGQGRRPECARCNCEKCGAETMACYGAPPGDAKLCADVITCGLDKGCSSSTCYCGSAAITACTLGLADGPCKTEVENASRSTTVNDIITRAEDSAYPVGRANKLSACASMNCKSECEIP